MIGWIGSTLLAFCGAPQAYKSFKQGHSGGLDTAFLSLWTLGELFTLTAILKDAPVNYLLFNYLANLLFLGVIWKYKFWRTS